MQTDFKTFNSVIALGPGLAAHYVSKVLCRLLRLMTRFRHPNFSESASKSQIIA